MPARYHKKVEMVSFFLSFFFHSFFLSSFLSSLYRASVVMWKEKKKVRFFSLYSHRRRIPQKRGEGEFVIKKVRE